MVARFADMSMDVEYPREMPPTEARRYASEAAATCAEAPRTVRILTVGSRVEAWANGHVCKEWEVQYA